MTRPRDPMQVSLHDDEADAARLARAKALFLDAIELGIADREAFVDRACADDAALRTLVLELLAGESMPLPVESLADDIRAAAAFAHAPEVTVSDRVALPREHRGSMIGRYRLLERIGEGGFGVVFAAEQTQPVKRRVALKLIKLGMDTHQVVARFEAERQALAMMDHPSIAKVFDGGATDTGRPYFVMELVRGLPLTHYCDQQKLAIEDRLKLFVQVCEAVQHAHSKGIIHRDLKPSNVLVTEDGSKALPKVIDFGIAKATNTSLTDKTIYTQVRHMIGTPEYMSPEQASVSSLDVDTRTDIYSLGVILYELLAGVTPFDGTRLRSAAYGEVQRIISEEEPPRPSTRISLHAKTMASSVASIAASRRTDASKLPGLIKGELDWIAMKAMDKDRSRRYQSAGSLASDVQRYLAGEAVLAAPPSTFYQTRKFVRRNWVLVSAGSAVAAALLLGAIGFAWQAQRAGRQRDIALAEQRRAENITAFVTTVLRGSDPDRAGGGEHRTVLQAMDLALAELDAGRFASDPTSEASLRFTIGEVFESYSRLEEAATVYAQAVKTLREQVPRGDARLAKALIKLAYMRYAQVRTDEANQLAEEAYAMIRREGNADPQMLGQTAEMVALTISSRDPDRALVLHRECLALERTLSPNGSERTATILWNIGNAELDNGRVDEGERAFRESLAVTESLQPPQPPLVAHSYGFVGIALRERGDLRGAERYLSEGLRRFSAAVTQVTFNFASHRRHLATIKADLGQAAEAEALCLEAAKFDLASRPLLQATVLSTRGRARQMLGRPTEARADFDESIAIIRRLEHADGARVLSGLLLASAQGYLANGDVASALRDLQELTALCDQGVRVRPSIRRGLRDALQAAREALPTSQAPETASDAVAPR